MSFCYTHTHKYTRHTFIYTHICTYGYAKQYTMYTDSIGRLRAVSMVMLSYTRHKLLSSAMDGDHYGVPTRIERVREREYVC